LNVDSLIGKRPARSSFTQLVLRKLVIYWAAITSELQALYLSIYSSSALKPI